MSLTAPTTVLGVAFQGKIQSAIGTAASLSSSTDGLLLYIGDGLPSQPSPLKYAYDGNGVGRSLGVNGQSKRTPPAGRYYESELKIVARGKGSAYSSSAVLPSNEFHRLMIASGFTATFSTNKWVYTPGSSMLGLTYEHYIAGKKYAFQDWLCDWSYEAPGLAPPIHTFKGMGLATALPTTASLQAVTYENLTVLPPLAVAVLGVLGSFTGANIKSHSFKLGRVLGPGRVRQNASGGHIGFLPEGIYPMWDVEIEEEAFVGSPFHTSSGIDADALKEAGTGIACSFSYVQGTGNNWKTGSAQAQIVGDVTPGNDGAAATVKFTLAGYNSTPVLNDSMYAEMY